MSRQHKPPPELPREISHAVAKLREIRGTVTPWETYEFPTPGGATLRCSGADLIRQADQIVGLVEAEWAGDERKIRHAIGQIFREQDRPWTPAIERIAARQLRWCHALNPPGHRLPRWRRAAALTRDNGTVFAPAAAAAREGIVFLNAVWSGNVPIVLHARHVYLPCGWIADKYPDVADLCQLIEHKVRTYFGATTEAEDA
jgi:hypothetical protein